MSLSSSADEKRRRQKAVEKNHNPNFVFYNSPPPPKFLPIGDEVEKYCRVRHATDENKVHAHCRQDT